MQTRSTSCYLEELNEQNCVYEVNIDFDEASIAWKNNKLNFACCNYVYICPFIKDNKKCGRRPYNGKQYCTIHSKLIK